MCHTCYFSRGKQLGSMFTKEPGQFFTLVPQIETDLLFRVFQTLLRGDTYTETTLEIYQSIRTFVIRKHMPMAKKAYLEKCIKLIAENGFSKKFFRDLPYSDYTGMKLAKRGGNDGFVHYAGLQEYIDANTEVTALPFDKLELSLPHLLCASFSHFVRQSRSLPHQNRSHSSKMP